MLLYKLILIIFLNVYFIKCEIFTSYYDMTSLVDNQINITKILKRYIEYQHERISKAIK